MADLEAFIEDVGTPRYITAAGATVVKVGAGKLWRVVFNNQINSVTTITSSDDGTTIATLKHLGNVCAPYEFKAAFMASLVVTLSQASAITVIYS